MSRALTRYARDVVRHWSERVGEPIVLSPREWRTIERWYDERVPLSLIAETIQETRTNAKGKPQAPPRSLSRLEAAVAESWALVKPTTQGDPHPATDDAETSPPTGSAEGPEGSPATTSVLGAGEDPVEAAWQRAAELADGAFSTWLRAQLAARAVSDDVAALDAEVDAALAEQAPAEALERARSRVDRQLADSATRLRRGALERTRKRAVARELRRSLDLPRFSGARSATLQAVQPLSGASRRKDPTA